MERPSHTLIPTSQRYRLPLLAMAASVQIGIVWLFVHGLSSGFFHVPPDLTGRLIPQKVTPHTDLPPPPPPEPEKIKTVIPDVPPFDYQRTADNHGVTATPEPGGTTGPVTVTPPVAPDRPAVGIAATHTVPPYPVVARRTGAQGQVTLLLTVAPTGRVSAAQVLASSGSDDLDQAARQWVLAHWAYRPALDHGRPVPSQATATMTFNLKDAR